MKNYSIKEKQLYDFVIRYKQVYKPEKTQEEIIKIFNAFNSSQEDHIDSLDMVLLYFNFIKKIL